MTTSWSVGCQPDMLNEYGSLVKDRKERVETRYARIYARSPSVINHFQTRARTMRVVPPESARSGDLLLPPTLSPRFCFRSPKPSFKRIQYASITPPTAIILVYTLYLHDAISRFSIGRIPKLISNQRFYFLLLFLPLLISRLSSLEIPFEMLEERSSSKRNTLIANRILTRRRKRRREKVMFDTREKSFPLSPHFISSLRDETPLRCI